MRKFFNYKLLAVAFVAFAMYSCDPDNESENARNIKPLVSANKTSFNVEEGQAAEITLTTTTPYKTTMEFKLELINGDRTNPDYVITPTPIIGPTAIADGLGEDGAYIIAFPANTSTYTFSITPDNNIFPDDSKSLQFALTTAGNSNGLVAPGSELITISVANKASDDLFTELAWDGTYIGTDNNEHSYCDFDFDLEIYDAGLNVVANSYTNCPESTFLTGDSPDGEYLVVPSFYSNGAPAVAPLSGEILYPVTLTIAKPGVFVSTIDLSDKWTFSGGGVNEGNPDGYYPAASVTKTGTTYIVRDINDPNIILGQGRIADLATMFKKHTKKKK